MNLLKEETSPYLRQHMDNPVEWMPWGPEALERARRESKPILLSIGYTACHWCHVMAHESFEDAATAELMNRHFINIKVDREERPDIDTVFQNALALMGKAGGWPLTIFLTADAKPFWGGTYFPPQARYGMPSFREVLQGVAESYERDPGKISHNVKNLTAALEQINSGKKGGLVNRDQIEQISGYFLSLIDPAHGGIGGAPKFPNLTVINLLWCSYIRTGNDAYKFAVIHSLTQMCQGGIYDHLGGGFARYSVDAEWLTPHFEKMLYDNAQFIALLSEVYKETRHPLFGERLEETVEWALREMTVRHFSHTAFAASLDADSEGVEGKYYVWTEEEIDRVLGGDAEAFKKTYDVTRFGNWENVNILNRLKYPDYRAPEEESRFRLWREKLKKVRDRRVPPQLDHKILADNNGLMIGALANAGFAMNRAEWIEAAENAFQFIIKNMADKDGRLSHVWCDGAPRHAGLLEDYANMADAALILYDITGKHDYLTQAIIWVDILNHDFQDQAGGGYYMTPTQTTDLLIRPKSAHDGAAPSGNGTLVKILAMLHFLTGKADYATLVTKTVEAFSGEIMNHVFPFATLLCNSSRLLDPVSLIIIGNDAAGFHDILRTLSLPALVWSAFPQDAILPKDHPAFGKTMKDGKTTAYLCFGRRCQAPATTPEELERLLRQERHRHGWTAINDG